VELVDLGVGEVLPLGCVNRLQLRRDGFESLAPRWRCTDEHAAPVRRVG
jgi:hypothetical protein